MGTPQMGTPMSHLDGDVCVKSASAYVPGDRIDVNISMDSWIVSMSYSIANRPVRGRRKCITRSPFCDCQRATQPFVNNNNKIKYFFISLYVCAVAKGWARRTTPLLFRILAICVAVVVCLFQVENHFQ